MLLKLKPVGRIFGGFEVTFACSFLVMTLKSWSSVDIKHILICLNVLFKLNTDKMKESSSQLIEPSNNRFTADVLSR